jgi:hypothetical protein
MEFIQKLEFSTDEKKSFHPLPAFLTSAILLCNTFIKERRSQKLCLVFPNKDFAAQWLSFPLTLEIIKNDWTNFKHSIYESYKNYKGGDKLLLNGKSIVEWVHADGEKIKIRTTDKDGCVTIFFLKYADIIKLTPAPAGKTRVSSLDRIKKDIPLRPKSPLDKLIEIEAYGNNLFQNNSICIVSKLKLVNESLAEYVSLNGFSVKDYFILSRIDENGKREFTNSPLLLTNKIINLLHYLSSYKEPAAIVIDGYSHLADGLTDFADIESFKIPTILITDLSESENFQKIKDLGFEFHNFSKTTIQINDAKILNSESPFFRLESKTKNYLDSQTVKIVVSNEQLQNASKQIHSLSDSGDNADVIALKISCIKLFNKLSHLCWIPDDFYIQGLTSSLNAIKETFEQKKVWLGNARNVFETILVQLESTITESKTGIEKGRQLIELLKKTSYHYVICSSDENRDALASFLRVVQHQHRIFNLPTVISISDLNFVKDGTNLKAILTGWPKSVNFNQLLFSFSFTQITLLFYEFENTYHQSLQRRNFSNISHLQSSPLDHDFLKTKQHFDEMFIEKESTVSETNSKIDILEWELSIDKKEYTKYLAGSATLESVRAKRVTFENNIFSFVTESHKYIVINELLEAKKGKGTIYRKKVDNLRTGDVVSIIKTDRDILADLVAKKTNPNELQKLILWTQLWKTLLREHFLSLGMNFKKLVQDLRDNDCIKHEATIRTWLQDPNRIGPDDDSDLISIAMMTKNDHLGDNIKTVRTAITKMKGLRHEASEFVISKITDKMRDMTVIKLNSEIIVEDLGKIFVLKISEINSEYEVIDSTYANKLLAREV